ncbi:GNAT family N-acetyltransferase [Paenibacillus antarcticus]|nr:GNAT family N-acetyltransferase [Paenibacillus antarcticus]
MGISEMNMNNLLSFSAIVEEDIEPLTLIMTRAFDEDARIHLGEGKTDGPEGYNNGEFLRKWALNTSNGAYKILLDGELIGAYILWVNDNGNNYLGNIFIDSSIQNKGIGRQVWGAIERKYPDTLKWIAETPGFSKRNHNFYINKCGFRLVEILNPGDIDKEMYVLHKEMSSFKSL